MLLHCLMQVCMGRGRDGEEERGVGGREGEREERRQYFCTQFLKCPIHYYIVNFFFFFCKFKLQFTCIFL